jgi:hypothetical protein
VQQEILRDFTVFCRLIFTMGAATSDALLEEEFPGEITQVMLLPQFFLHRFH